MLGRHAANLTRLPDPADLWESLGLGAVLALLLAISAANLSSSELLAHDAQRAPWCPPGEVPEFRFGFAQLAGALGGEMGRPIECEHGGERANGTVQATTTGLATYSWCTNTPTFSRGQEHWMLTPETLQHWSGNANAPWRPPVVRAPDLRQLCPT